MWTLNLNPLRIEYFVLTEPLSVNFPSKNGKFGCTYIIKYKKKGSPTTLDFFWSQLLKSLVAVDDDNLLNV